MKKQLFLLPLALAATLTACSNNAGAANSPAQESVSVPATTISQQDFINAAESTVNGVVSVKSFATPSRRRSYGSYGSQGGMDPFDDPFFQYFFGVP